MQSKIGKPERIRQTTNSTRGTAASHLKYNGVTAAHQQYAITAKITPAVDLLTLVKLNTRAGREKSKSHQQCANTNHHIQLPHNTAL